MGCSLSGLELRRLGSLSGYAGWACPYPAAPLGGGMGVFIYKKTRPKKYLRKIP